MEELLKTAQTIGIGGIFVVIIIREVFSFLERRRGKNGNGTPAWADALTRAFEHVAEAGREQTGILREIAAQQQASSRRLEELAAMSREKITRVEAVAERLERRQLGDRGGT